MVWANTKHPIKLGTMNNYFHIQLKKEYVGDFFQKEKEIS